MDLGLGGHYYNKSEEFEACFVFILQLHSTPDVTVGGLVSIPWCIITHYDTCNAARLFIKISFLTIFALWTMHKHSLLRFSKGSKTPVCEIWWLLVERIVIARTRYRRAIDTLMLLFTIKSGFVQLLSITEHTGPSNLHSAHIHSRNILKDRSWTPLEYLWMLINMFTLTVLCIISHSPLTSLLFS